MNKIFISSILVLMSHIGFAQEAEQEQATALQAIEGTWVSYYHISGNPQYSFFVIGESSFEDYDISEVFPSYNSELQIFSFDYDHLYETNFATCTFKQGIMKPIKGRVQREDDKLICEIKYPWETYDREFVPLTKKLLKLIKPVLNQK